jgi:hypothetical protein
MNGSDSINLDSIAGKSMKAEQNFFEDFQPGQRLPGAR